MPDEALDPTWEAVEALARADLLRRNCRTCRWCEQVPYDGIDGGHWDCHADQPDVRALAAEYREATQPLRDAALLDGGWPDDDVWPQPPCPAWDDSPRWRVQAMGWGEDGEAGRSGMTIVAWSSRGKP